VKLEGKRELRTPRLSLGAISGWIHRKWFGGAGTGLIWPRIGRFRAFVNAVMNLQVP